jgi:putative nucleotidyltransferase with HDIG domain
MKEILFVDDEPMVLKALERMLFGMRHEWGMRFAGSGAEALRVMAERPADVVVSDMRMPEMNGAELLNEIMQRHPKSVRIILTGYADEEMVLQCVGGTHQFLAKPCNSEMLRSVVQRALSMDEWLDNVQIKTLVSGMKTVPSLPSLYFEILRELRSPDAALDRVGATIAKDMAMTAKMLQLVNSAFFGLRRQLSDPTEAVAQLGMETVKSLVLTIHVFSELSSESTKAQVESIYHHSLATATTAKKIAQLEGLEHRVVEECFTAGLLHDIGRLALISNLPEKYAEATALSARDTIPLWQAEKAVFGVSHAEVGGYLLGLWGLPIAIVEAAVFHHRPGVSPSGAFGSLTAVHAANFLEHTPSHPDALLPQLDQDYLTRVGVWDHVPRWREISRKTQPEP